MGKNNGDKVKTVCAVWAGLAHVIGNLQARVLLTIVYALVLLPFGICARLFADTLRTKQRPTRWLGNPQQTVDLPWAHKQ
jgi:hypothetical protein